MTDERKPQKFQTLAEAREYSVHHFVMIWAKVWSWSGVFQIYPGGREIHWR